MFSIDGLVSGFDTTSIIESLLGFQQSQVDTFNSRKAEITTRQSAFKGIEASLISLQGSLTRLNRSTASVFDAKTATSSNEDILTLAADGKAQAGSYQLTVNSLATAHQVASQGFATTSDSIGTGDVTLSVGGGESTTITIDQTNNTVLGLVGAINDQVADVNASVIFDQGASSYRILLSSTKTGASNQISVTNTLSGGAAPDFSGPAVQDAADAVVTLGSGAGAISAQFESNTIDGLIENVTIDLKSASPTTSVTLTVAADSSNAKESIETFVTDFNAIIEFIDEQTRFNPETEEGSPLLGNRSAIDIKNRLLGLVSGAVDTGTNLNRLSQIGVEINLQGRLEIDSGKLDQALSGELTDVDPGEIRKLFGLDAVSSNSGIEFLAGGTRTKDSSTPYQVDITQAAEQASITATTALAASIVIDDNNNGLQITVDGITSDPLTLTNGTYTQAELAAHIERVVSDADSLGVHNVLVGVSASNELTITSEAYGVSSQVSSVSGSAAATLGFDGTEIDTGADVVGSFIVNGQTETAVGSGRVLRGESDNENTADLQLLVTLNSAGVIAGAEADVQVTRGVTGGVGQYITSLLNAESGLLKNVNDEFEARIESIDDSIERVEAITASKRDALIQEFTVLEGILSELQNVGSIISTQLQSLGAFSGNQNNN